LSDRDVLRVEEITAMTAPGVSSTMPGGGAHKRSRDPFWDDLLIDRRTLGEKLPPYEPSVSALIDGLEEMVVIRQKAVAAGVASGGTARAVDRRELRVAELPPRVLFDRPLESDPRRPVLRPIPTYYVLH
jgi:hypothetical protein